MPYNFYLGIDVSKASLSVVLMNSDSKVLWSSKKIANQPSIKDCFKTCRRG